MDTTTSGTITASIDTDETVTELKTLTGTTHAYTIVIAAGDATSSSADDLNTINEKTTAAINASAITALTSDTIDNIKTLLTAGNDTDQFTDTSFASLTGVTVSDETLDGSKLADAIDQANSATGDTSVVFTISAANTIEGSEANFTALLTDDGNNQIDIDDQDISVSGTISVDNANLLDTATCLLYTSDAADE